MRRSGHAVIVILVGLLTLIAGAGVAGAHAASPPEQLTPLAVMARVTNVNGKLASQSEHLTSEHFATAANTSANASTSDTHAGTVDNSNQNQGVSDRNLQPSPPSGVMTFSAWLALAAFIIGVAGLVAAAVILRRINE